MARARMHLINHTHRHISPHTTSRFKFRTFDVSTPSPSSPSRARRSAHPVATRDASSIALRSHARCGDAFHAHTFRALSTFACAAAATTTKD